jgi:hypothetical protein
LPAFEGKPTVAAIASRLGVPEAEVMHLVKHPELVAPPEPTNLTLFASILATWSTDQTFCGPYGLPLHLPVSDVHGHPSFSDLVRKLRPDADVIVVMEEMLREGAIEQAGPNHVRMVERRMLLERKVGDASSAVGAPFFEYLGMGLEQIATTSHHNVATKDPTKKFFQRTAFNDQKIPREELPAIRMKIYEMFEDVIFQFDNYLLDVSRKHQGTIKDGVTVCLTLFQTNVEDQSVPDFNDKVTTPVSPIPAWTFPKDEP